MIRKHRLQLVRSPAKLLLLCISSILSTVFAWIAVRGDDGVNDFDRFNVPLDSCGVVDVQWWLEFSKDNWREASEVPVGYNDAWQTGSAVTVMTLGPMIHAVVAFLAVQEDIQVRRRRVRALFQ